LSIMRVAVGGIAAHGEVGIGRLAREIEKDEAAAKVGLPARGCADDVGEPALGIDGDIVSVLEAVKAAGFRKVARYRLAIAQRGEVEDLQTVVGIVGHHVHFVLIDLDIAPTRGGGSAALREHAKVDRTAWGRNVHQSNAIAAPYQS